MDNPSFIKYRFFLCDSDFEKYYICHKSRRCAKTKAEENRNLAKIKNKNLSLTSNKETRTFDSENQD